MGILRFLLALSVVIAHIGPLYGIALLGGKIAVQAFFIISGFYMAFILNEKYVGENNSYFLYISNRFLRIYPLYWVMLLLTGIFLLLSSHTGLVFHFTPNFVGNAIKQISLFFTIDYLYYDPKTYGNLLIPPSWTLGLELLFYLVAPFIVRNPKRLILLFSLGLLSRIIFAHFYIPYPGNYVDRFVPTVAVYFLAGALAYFIYRKVKKFNKTRFLSISGAFLILTLLYQQLLQLSNKTIPEIIYFVLLMGSLPFLFLFSRKFKIDRILGDLSYPIYIIHTLCILLFFSWGVQKTDFMKAVLVLAIIIMAYVLDRVLLIPIDAIRQARVKNALKKKVAEQKKDNFVGIPALEPAN